MSSDGLSDTEKVKLLFKNYMSYTSTESNQDFPNENLLSYHTNIFANNVLSEIPPKEPSYDIDVSNVELLHSILGNEFDFKIDGDWFDAKKGSTGSFTTDSSNIVLRLEKINLDYLEGGTSSFVCFDNCGNNILKNLIPQNYGPVGSPIYSLILYYDTGSKLVEIDWLLKSTTVRSQLDDSDIQFGAPLFDAKNGIITFYDVSGAAGSVFNDISSNFYLTATKYVGKIGTLDADTIKTLYTNGNAEIVDLSDALLDYSFNDADITGTLKCQDIEATNKVQANFLYANNVVQSNYIELNEISNTVTDITRGIRYLSNMYQVYTGEMWTGLSTHRTDQPPPLIEGSQTIQNSSIQISWTKFPEVYKDAVDGKSFPIYSFTFVDISDQHNTDWETISILPGNYDPVSKQPINNLTTTITYDRMRKQFENYYSADISFYDISFVGRPTLRPSADNYFSNNYTFDLRIYGVNYSGRTPNYLIIRDLSFNPTDEPGPVKILTFSYSAYSIDMDVSFDLDVGTTDISETDTADIPIDKYEISYNLLESKRFNSMDSISLYQVNQEISGNNSMANLELLDLLPGAKYEIQIRAKNEIDGSYGIYGTAMDTSFTHISNTQYIDISALEPVDASMTLDLSNASPIHCYVNNGTSLDERTIANKNSFIDISGTTGFYVNYGIQGIDISNETSSLVDVVFTKKSGGANGVVETLSYTKDKDSPMSVNFLGILFESSLYDDAGNDISLQDISKNKGFVYSSSVRKSSGSNIDISTNFDASTNPYEVTYSIDGSNSNVGKELNHHEDLSINRTTSEFYYDDYNTTPTITDMNTEISANGTFLFGIPSVSTLTLTYDISVSNFASRIIPHDASHNHAIISDISGQGIYDFQASYVKDISSTSPYVIDTSVNSDVSSGYISTIDTSFTVSVYYLDHLSNDAPTRMQKEQTIDVSINQIFQDSATIYTSDISMYAFDGISMDVNNMVEINPSDNDFKNTYSSDISHMLLYFDGKFVSGGYDGGATTPFQDWSTFALPGPNYFDISSTEVDNLKWIAIEVPSTYIVNNNDVNLSTFQINGGDFWSYREMFGNEPTTNNDVYEAYIYNDGKFGPLHTLRNIGDSTNFWYKATTATITNARTYYKGGGQYNGALKTKTTAFLNPSRTTGSKVYLVVGLRYNATHHFTFS